MDLTKDTIEKILTYESDDDDSITDVLLKQIVCLKEAVLLYDKLFDHFKEEIIKLQDESFRRWPLSESNFETITNSINQILTRLRKLEGKE